MAFDWEHVEAIRAEQNSARAKRDINTLPTDETSERIYNSPTGIDTKIPKLDHWEQMIQKVRTQLIDYIISHGLVQGFEYDGIDEPIKNGKIVLTADMLKRVTNRFGYFREKETREFIEQFLPEHFYVSDENYVHTDNNYTDTEKEKLEGIADGAEVNKVISILFNGVESINPETRIATITITPADVKAWYEQNLDTNVFTDAEKAKLESIDIDALSNKVEDVTLDGETIVKNKVAILTAKKIKDSYESNTNTNAFTDADKALVEQVLPEVQKGVHQHEQRIDALEKSQTVQDAEIADTKNSISELGDEVNSVAGRVTNLEGSQKAQDGEISILKQKNTEQDGKLDALETWKDTVDTTTTELGEENTAQDREISNLKGKDTEQDGRLDALEVSDTTQNADILQLKEDVKSAGKVDDVQVDGTSVVEAKIAKIPKIFSEEEINQIVSALITQGYVPYSGATSGLNLGDQQLDVQGSVHLTGYSYIKSATFGNGSGSGRQYTEAYARGIGAGCDIKPAGNGLVAVLDTTGGSSDAYGRLMLARGDTEYTNFYLYTLSEPEGEHNGLVLYPSVKYRVPGTASEFKYYMGRFRTNTPANNLDAANKKYVDDKIATLQATIDNLTARIAALESK